MVVKWRLGVIDWKCHGAVFSNSRGCLFVSCSMSTSLRLKGSNLYYESADFQRLMYVVLGNEQGRKNGDI